MNRIKLTIDLGDIGHESDKLLALTSEDYSTNLEDAPKKYIMFVDYRKGKQKGVKVFTNAFDTESKFKEYLFNKLLKLHVDADKSGSHPTNFKIIQN